MDLTAFSDRLSMQLLDFAWDEWAQMGVSATAHHESHWAQDPEALLVFTLEVARADPRLFDELLDWALHNEGLLSVRRLRAMCIDETDRALVAATISWLGRRRPRARLRSSEHHQVQSDLELLFDGRPAVGDADPDFAAQGLLRPPAEPSRKSQAPDLRSPINLDFRLRAMLGVGIRAEVVRIMLCVHAPWMTAGALARTSVYAKRNVHDALAGLADAGAISVFTTSGEQRYTIDKSAWAALLDLAPTKLPSHREWPQLLAVLRTILRWSRQPDLIEASEYLRASATRQLLEHIRPELAFAGVKTNLRATAAEAPAALEKVVQDILADRHLARDRVKQEEATEFKARLVERAGSVPSPSDEELAAEIVARRHP
jgi:hypothetical protein